MEVFKAMVGDVQRVILDPHEFHAYLILCEALEVFLEGEGDLGEWFIIFIDVIQRIAMITHSRLDPSFYFI